MITSLISAIKQPVHSYKGAWENVHQLLNLLHTVHNVRPLVGYASVVWSPYVKADILRIEMVDSTVVLPVENTILVTASKLMILMYGGAEMSIDGETS